MGADLFGLPAGDFAQELSKKLGQELKTQTRDQYALKHYGTGVNRSGVEATPASFIEAFASPQYDAQLTSEQIAQFSKYPSFFVNSPVVTTIDYWLSDEATRDDYEAHFDQCIDNWMALRLRAHNVHPGQMEDEW